VLGLFSEKIPLNHVTTCHEAEQIFDRTIERSGKAKRDRGCGEILIGFDRTDRLPGDAGHIGQRTLRKALRQPQTTEAVFYIAGRLGSTILTHDGSINSKHTLQVSRKKYARPCSWDQIFLRSDIE
jgi:hypothetical protein